MTRGRKRKAGKREPNGKLSRKAEHQQERRTGDEEAAMSVAKAARVRVHAASEQAKVSVANAGTDMAATVIGRLYLNGHLEPEQVNAARMLSDAYAAYQRAVDSPRPPKAMSLGEASGPIPADMDPERAYRARSQWGTMMALLQAENSTRRASTIYAACYYVVLRDLDLPHLFDDMRLGLSVIALTYGLAEKAA